MQVSQAIPTTDVSRRSLLTTSGTFVAGAGLATLAGSAPAKAAVSTRELDIQPAEVSGKDTSVTQATLQVAGAYEYQVEHADALALTLAVAPEDSEDYQAIDEITESGITASGAAQYSLSGSLVDHPALDYATFSADTAETVELSLPVRVELTVSNGGESVVTARAHDLAQITVSNTGVEATAALTGEGEVGIEV